MILLNRKSYWPVSEHLLNGVRMERKHSRHDVHFVVPQHVTLVVPSSTTLGQAGPAASVEDLAVLRRKVRVLCREGAEQIVLGELSYFGQLGVSVDLDVSAAPRLSPGVDMFHEQLVVTLVLRLLSEDALGHVQLTSSI